MTGNLLHRIYRKYEGIFKWITIVVLLSGIMYSFLGLWGTYTGHAGVDAAQDIEITILKDRSTRQDSINYTRDLRYEFIIDRTLEVREELRVINKKLDKLTDKLHERY